MNAKIKSQLTNITDIFNLGVSSQTSSTFADKAEEK